MLQAQGQLPLVALFLCLQEAVAFVNRLAMTLGGGLPVRRLARLEVLREMGECRFWLQNYRAVNHLDGQDVPEAQTHLRK